MTRVKICGVCSAADAAVADDAGTDYVGVILAPGRTRTRTVTQAADIFAAARALRVGVFVDAAAGAVGDAVAALGLNVVQLHGRESPATVRALRAGCDAHIWKAVGVRSADDVVRAASAWGGIAHGLLLDGIAGGATGGVGAAFDWEDVARVRADLNGSLTLIVAGGLRPQNVARVVSLLQPDIVDVSSGVEEELCRKSAARVAEFVSAVRGAEVRS